MKQKTAQLADDRAAQINRLMRDYHPDMADSVLAPGVLELLPAISKVERARDPIVWLRIFHYLTDSDWLVTGAGNWQGVIVLRVNALLKGELQFAEWGLQELRAIDSIRPIPVEYDHEFTPMPWSQAREIYRQPREPVVLQQPRPKKKRGKSTSAKVITIPIATIRFR